MEHQELLVGFIRLHVLHRAAESELIGQWMIEDLGWHGYRLSPGTLYPLLEGLEKRGYLVPRRAQAGRGCARCPETKRRSRPYEHCAATSPTIAGRLERT